ncbi:unnamed protein product [Polarella glacialis]|uniref:Cyclic nucleotide-binding domain-containing protein n=2 Tax=Polarella glacialis TaxID=89957 RepID=A0A813DTL9_POLGL|nr:unnamed protein product [Polarella glacialis]
MGLSKLARISRIARVVRLLRLVRMQEVIANITERIQSDQIHFVMQICKPLILLLFFGHVIACGWWGVGLESGESAWIDEAGYTDQGLETQYLVSLHWSLAQFSTGMGEVTSSSAGEQMYAVFVCVVSFMVSLVMTSVLTSNLTQKYIIGGAGARQLSTLKKYLKQNNVPKNLTKRVCRNAKHAISGDLTPDTVDLLGVISEPLKIEMHFEIYSRILAWHPFFHDYLTDSTGGQVMRRVCHQAMSMLLLASGDVVFSSGEEPSDPKMYIVVSGQLGYLDSYGETTVLHERMWAAEAAIWTQWKHRGTLTATSDVKLALLDAETFQYICKRQMKKQKKGFTPKRYASEFVEEMNNVDDLTDICTDQT